MSRGIKNERDKIQKAWLQETTCYHRQNCMSNCKKKKNAVRSVRKNNVSTVNRRSIADCLKEAQQIA